MKRFVAVFAVALLVVPTLKAADVETKEITFTFKPVAEPSAAD